MTKISKFFGFILGLNLIVIGGVQAATTASCKVEVFRNNQWIELIKTPNLQAYSSFRIPTCNFSTPDGKIRLATALLRGNFAVVLYSENKEIVKSSLTIPQKVQLSFSNAGFLPSGEEISYSCNSYFDPADISDIITCQ